LKHLQENPFQKCDNLESISSAMADYSRALASLQTAVLVGSKLIPSAVSKSTTTCFFRSQGIQDQCRLLRSGCGTRRRSGSVLSGSHKQRRAPAPQLSARELECLKWTAEGKTSAGIGDKICVSSATVNYHLNNAIKKLGASNRHHAAILAMRKGLIS